MEDEKILNKRPIFYLKCLFSILGLAPFSMTSSTKDLRFQNSPNWLRYSVFLIFFDCGIFPYGILLMINGSNSQIEKFKLYFLAGVAATIFAILILVIIQINHVLAREKLTRILSDLYEIYSSVIISWEDKSIVLIFIMNCIFIAIATASGYFSCRNWSCPITSFWSNSIVSGFSFQYTAITKIISIAFGKVNRALQEDQIKFLSRHKEIYSSLCNLSNQVSVVFGVPILATIFYQFLTSVVHLYFAILFIMSNEAVKVINSKSKMLWVWNFVAVLQMIILHIFNILTLTRNITNILKEVSLAYEVFKKDIFTKDIRSQVEFTKNILFDLSTNRVDDEKLCKEVMEIENFF